jgi:uncharacterized protein YodC (DUF2158 family)
MDFKVGDVVKLKHGGPNMTIRAKNAYGKYDEVETNWFVEDHLHTGTFPVDTLLLVSTELVSPVVSPVIVENASLSF